MYVLHCGFSVLTLTSNLLSHTHTHNSTIIWRAENNKNEKNMNFQSNTKIRNKICDIWRRKSKRNRWKNLGRTLLDWRIYLSFKLYGGKCKICQHCQVKFMLCVCDILHCSPSPIFLHLLFDSMLDLWGMDQINPNRKIFHSISHILNILKNMKMNGLGCDSLSVYAYHWRANKKKWMFEHTTTNPHIGYFSYSMCHDLWTIDPFERTRAQKNKNKQQNKKKQSKKKTNTNLEKQHFADIAAQQ